MRLAAPALAAAVAFTFASAPSYSQGLPDTLRMSCAQAQAMVRTSGAIVLATGPTLYDRYVTGRRYCNPDQETRPAWVRSADNAQCFIGERCVDVDYSVR